MKNLSLIASALAMLGLTACEKGLDEGIADVAPKTSGTGTCLAQEDPRLTGMFKCITFCF